MRWVLHNKHFKLKTMKKETLNRFFLKYELGAIILIGTIIGLTAVFLDTNKVLGTKGLYLIIGFFIGWVIRTIYFRTFPDYDDEKKSTNTDIMNITKEITEDMSADVKAILIKTPEIQIYANHNISKYQWRDSRHANTTNVWDNVSYDTRSEIIDAITKHLKS